MGESFWTHAEIVGAIIFPLGSGIGYLIWQLSQLSLKVDTMWLWYSNDGHEITGYKPGDEKRKRK